MVIANIIADVIIDLSSSIPCYLKENGLFIASGIIKERKKEVLDKYLSEGFECEDTIEMGEWVAMTLRCPGSL